MMRTTETALLLALVLTAACDDPTPVVVDGAAGVVDSPVETGSTVSACQACLMAPDDSGAGCQTEYTACQNNAQCAALLACSYAMHCFGGTATAFLACDLPCAMEGGLAIGSGPGYMAAAGVFNCVTVTCSAACLTP